MLYIIRMVFFQFDYSDRVTVAVSVVQVSSVSYKQEKNDELLILRLLYNLRD